MAVILLICIGVIIGYMVVILYTNGKKKENLGKHFPVPDRNFPVYIGEKVYLSSGQGGFLVDEAPDVEPGTYYVSRSCAVETIALCKKKNMWYVLANKRGKGCFNNVGLWNVPSGYVDYGEECEEAAVRETHEETGVMINKNDLTLYTIDSVPEGRQNIVIVYYTIVDPKNTDTTSKYAEKDEVEEILWISEDSLDKVRWISTDHIKRVKDVIKLMRSRDEINNK